MKAECLEKKRARLLALSLACVLGLAGCGGGSSGSPSPGGVRVTLSPATVSVAIGDTQQFTAAVTGSSNLAVTWSVNGTPGGDATFGIISATGSYTAPDALPSANAATITATSQADSSKSASAVVTLTAKLAAIDPIVAMQNSSPFILRVFGRGFTVSSVLTVGGSARTTTFVSSTELRAQISSADTASAGLLAVAVQEGGAETVPLDFSVVPELLSTDVLATAGLETTGVDIPVIPVSSPTLSLAAVGIGDTAGSVGFSVSRGSSVQVFLAGQGILPGTYYLIDGASGEFDFAQPLAADFTETTDGLPAVQFQIAVSPTAALGPRNLMVLNVSGELAVFNGAILVKQ